MNYDFAGGGEVLAGCEPPVQGVQEGTEGAGGVKVWVNGAEAL